MLKSVCNVLLSSALSRYVVLEETLKLKLVTISALALLSISSFAKTKYDITTRSEEAEQACQSYLVTSAYEPASMSFDDGAHFDYGHMLSRNQIFVYKSGTGANQLGIVHSHIWECQVSCAEGSACVVTNQVETR